MEVLLREAGRKLDPTKDYTDHTHPYELAYHDKWKFFTDRRPIQSKCLIRGRQAYRFGDLDLKAAGRDVFVMDGGRFVSSGCQNPTRTMMAITGRACDYLVTEAKGDRL